MTIQSRNICATNHIEWHKVACGRPKSGKKHAGECYSLIINIKYNIIYIYIIVLNATVQELSHVLSFCRFCHFLVYNSVRFIYISVTLSFFFSCLPPMPPVPPAVLPDNLRHEWHLIDFKQFFLAKTLAKTCPQCHQNGKSLIFKRIFICQMRHEPIL